MKVKIFSAILTCVVGSSIVAALRAKVSEPRVHYGSASNPSDFPFLIKMSINGSLGAGSIISNNWILTAAHCIHNVRCDTIELIMAAAESQSVIHPLACHPHPNYALALNPHHAYDVGLIEIREDLLQYPGSAAIPLPVPGAQFPVGTPAIILGWGLTEQNTLPDTLLRAEVKVEHWETCRARYYAKACGTYAYCVADIPRRIICTQGDGYFPALTCYGDSGGPVIINGVLAGIVSFGISEEFTCMPNSPSMQVNVADYLPWIYSFVYPTIDTADIPVEPEA